MSRQQLVAVAAKAIEAAILPDGRARATVFTKLDVVDVVGGAAFEDKNKLMLGSVERSQSSIIFDPNADVFQREPLGGL